MNTKPGNKGKTVETLRKRGLVFLVFKKTIPDMVVLAKEVVTSPLSPGW